MKTIRGRLLILVAALTALAFGGMAWLAFAFLRGSLEADRDAHLKAVAFSASRLVDVERPVVHTYMEQGLGLVPGEGFMLIFDADGHEVARSGGFEEKVDLSAATREVAPGRYDAVVETRTTGSGRKVRVATFARTDFIAGRKDVRLFCQAGTLLDRHEARLGNLALTMAALALGLWVLAVLSVWPVTHHWLRSLGALGQAARQMSQARQTRQRLHVDPRDAEIAQLAESVNRLLDDVDDAHTTQQQFVADASHELRTPLTILRGEIEVALRKPRSAEDYREVLVSSREEIDKLSRLTENLLVLARADAGQLARHREPVDLSTLARTVAGMLNGAAADRKLALIVEAAEPVTVDGDPTALERALANLVENAIAYCPPGEEITLAAAQAGGHARLRVSDSGPGIAPEHAAHVFDRFYRVSRSRSRDGTGLGLAIVKAIAEAHGGRVPLESRPGHGCVFTLELPVTGRPDGKSGSEPPG